MRYSKLIGKTRKEAPKDAETISHKLLTRAGFVDQLIAGAYSFLPLGWKVHQKVTQIIREEIGKLGAQELNMPTLQSKEQWLEGGRGDTYDPPLFKLKDRHDRETALAPTHEEVITDITRRFISSYKDLPFSAFQIQNKFRNEMRATGGLLRVREFVMMDLYSFHESKESLDEFFLQVVEAYKRIFERCKLVARPMYALSGPIGGNDSLEFGVETTSGEDTMFYCKKCDYAANIEKLTPEEVESYRNKKSKCPNCKSEIFETKNVENGHVFKLMDKYSRSMNAQFTDKDGQRKHILMGCYGIGVGRLMATIVEVHHDDKGIIWPKSVAPFEVHLVSLNENAKAEEVYKELIDAGVEVVYDDREDLSAGEKLNDCDLIGIPVRAIVSAKSLEKGGVEVKERSKEESKIVKLSDLANELKTLR